MVTLLLIPGDCRPVGHFQNLPEQKTAMFSKIHIPVQALVLLGMAVANAAYSHKPCLKGRIETGPVLNQIGIQKEGRLMSAGRRSIMLPGPRKKVIMF